MRYANLETSSRLQRVYGLLLKNQGNPISTLEIANQARVCAVNSCISEIRQNGVDVKCKRKGDYWYYWINCEGLS